jgi:tripartite-type tricarboxylate transporter receptor subunit TctC
VWQGVTTPPATIANWHAESAPEMKTPLQHEGSEAVGSSPSEFGNIIKSEVDRWKAVSKAAGIKAE